MKLDIYLNYRGNCEQAFRFYEQNLGGKITGVVRHAEQPNPGVPADWKEKILHADTVRQSRRYASRQVRDIVDASPST